MARGRRRPSEAEALDYVRCRSLGHSWDAVPVTKPAPYGVALDLRCEHCHTERRDILSRYSGQLLSRQYRHPDGYKDTSEDGHTRSDWRAMYVTTLAEHLRSIAPVDEKPAALSIVRSKQAQPEPRKQRQPRKQGSGAA